MNSLVTLSMPAVLLAAMLLAGGSPAPDDREGIHVTGVGEAAVKPDTVLIRGDFSASADTATDALTKFRDGRRRATKMIEALGIAALTIAGPGPTLTVVPAMNERGMRGMVVYDSNAQADVDGKYLAREPLTIRIGNLAEQDASVDVIAKVLDKVKEAGLKVGAPPENMNNYMRGAFGNIQMEEQKDATVAIVYVVSDRGKFEEAACTKAMEDASRRAAMLAKLANRKVGRVISVTQPVVNAEKITFDGVFRVSLQVVFELEG